MSRFRVRYTQIVTYELHVEASTPAAARAMAAREIEDGKADYEVDSSEPLITEVEEQQ